jgi:hypothetical protein
VSLAASASGDSSTIASTGSCSRDEDSAASGVAISSEAVSPEAVFSGAASAAASLADAFAGAVLR